MTKTIIVGGIAGGATAAARLRRLDEKAQIILFERGEYISTANCGIPYYIGNVISDRAKLLLQKPQGLRDRFNIDVRVRSEVIAIDRRAKTVLVRDLVANRDYQESYDKLILAPGGVPFAPSAKGSDSPGVFTLRDLPDADKIKAFVEANHAKSATIVGAGFSGLELAENLQNLGLTINILQLSETVLPVLDLDMTPTVHDCLKRRGVNLYRDNSVEVIAPTSNRLALKLKQGDLITDLVIFSVGTRPESVLAQKAGLKTNERGGIVVDQRQRTSDADIYAVGDASETFDFLTKNPTMVPLAALAHKQARVAADNIGGLDSEYQGTIGSSIIKIFELTVGATGMNEKTAQRLGLAYDKVFLLAPAHSTYYPNANSMWLKVLFENTTGKLLGAQIVGTDGVDKRLDVLSVAIQAGLAANALGKLDLAYAPPYSTVKDPVNLVGLMIENLMKGLTKRFHWHDVDKLPQNGQALLLDVRGADEFAKGHLPGFVNLPLKKLRASLGELDKSKPTYLNCEAGLRSYIAARLLKSHGFDAHYLSGGYRLYTLVKNG
jgi:NADPH-dependent 2,4-dienoyl-CoA reductase/sulfur reductase-like enzyme/rhodanese-related sulfurtransferase